MDKLSERIRRPAQDASFDGDVYAIRGEWFEEMANEVAQLEAENVDLREELYGFRVNFLVDLYETGGITQEEFDKKIEALKAGGEPWDKEVVGDEEWY